jgi:hypothetical protein
MSKERPLTNKQAELAEDQHRLGALVHADAAEYRVPAKAVTYSREKTHERADESPEVRSLRRRIAYFEDDTLEDPNVRAHMLRMLRARLSAATARRSAAPSAAVRTTAPAKTGWWDPAFRERDRGEDKEVKSSGPEAARPIDLEREGAQMSRLVRRTSALRKEAGFSEKEAKEQSEHYKDARSGIDRIRYRLKKLKEGSATEANKSEIQELRDELARDLKELRRDLRSKEASPNASDSGSNQEKIARTDAAADLQKVGSENASLEYNERSPYEWHAAPTVTSNSPAHESAPEYPPIPEEDQKEWDAWNSFGDALRSTSENAGSDESQPKLHEQHNENAQREEETEERGEGDGANLEKGYEDRLALRNEWRSAKRAYDDAYRIYLEDRAYERSQKGILGRAAFWKRESQPQILLDLEASYKDARRTYAESVSEALRARSEDADEEQESGIRAALANRFVLQAAHDRLEAERAFIPQGKDRRILENLQAVFKKHRFAIRAAGYATVAGVGLASGGIGLAIIALSKKAVQAKISAGLVLGGAFVGAAAGGSISDSLISYNEARRDSALRKARYSFSPERLDALEKAYLKGYRGHEAAVRNQKRIIAAGTITGGVLGAVAASKWDDLLTLQTPEVPQTPIAAPAPEAPIEMVPEMPPTEVPEEAPETITPEVPEEAPETIAPEIPEGPSEELIPPEELRLDDGSSLYESAPSSEAPVLPEEVVLPDVPFTFEEGNRVDTVSEALFETWKLDPDLVSEHLSHKEFLAQMYGAIAALEEEPAENADLLDAMGITSGDIDTVAVGQTINLKPFFAYMNERL